MVRLAPISPPQRNNKSGDKLRVGSDIRAATVRLIGGEGESLGVVSLADALHKATQSGLDLVEISPNATPPVCKLLDHGKYRYQEQKKRTAARKHQKSMDVKEIKVRPNIGEHDFAFKMRTMEKFLTEGSRVKISLRFRGREMAYTEHGRALMERILNTFAGQIKIVQDPQMEGRQMVMVLTRGTKQPLVGQSAGNAGQSGGNAGQTGAQGGKTVAGKTGLQIAGKASVVAKASELAIANKSSGVAGKDSEQGQQTSPQTQTTTQATGEPNSQTGGEANSQVASKGSTQATGEPNSQTKGKTNTAKTANQPASKGEPTQTTGEPNSQTKGKTNTAKTANRPAGGANSQTASKEANQTKATGGKTAPATEPAKATETPASTEPATELPTEPPVAGETPE